MVQNSELSTRWSERLTAALVGAVAAFLVVTVFDAIKTLSTDDSETVRTVDPATGVTTATTTRH